MFSQRGPNYVNYVFQFLIFSYGEKKIAKEGAMAQWLPKYATACVKFLVQLLVENQDIQVRIILFHFCLYIRWDTFYLASFKTNHHHHIFLNCPFLQRSARVRRFSRYEASPHIPEHYPFRVQTQLIHIILHTFSPSLPTPTCTSHPCHHHIFTGWHPIISTLMPNDVHSGHATLNFLGPSSICAFVHLYFL